MGLCLYGDGIIVHCHGIVALTCSRTEGTYDKTYQLRDTRTALTASFNPVILDIRYAFMIKFTFLLFEPQMWCLTVPVGSVCF